MQRQVAQQASRAIDPNDEDAAGHWVKSSSVADLASTHEAPHPPNHLVRRDAGRFVNDEDARLESIHRSQYPDSGGLQQAGLPKVTR